MTHDENMVFKYFKPSDKVIGYAIKISRYAHMPWVPVFFFMAFFLDCFLMFVPADGLIAVSVLFAPDKKRTWYFAAVAGAVLAVLVFYFLSISELRGWTIDFLASHTYENFYQDFVRTTRKEGYLALCIATITFVPPAIGMIAGAVAGLDPLVVFLIVGGLKSLRIWLLMEIVKRGWSAVVHLKHKIEHRHDAAPPYGT